MAWVEQCFALDHGEEARNGNVECTLVRIVSGCYMGWTW